MSSAAALVRAQEIREIIADRGVGERTELNAEILAQVIRVSDINAEFEAVLGFHPRDSVRELSAALIRECRALKECGNAEVKTDARAADDRNVWRQAEGIGVTRKVGRSKQVGLFVRVRSLWKFEFQVAAVLEASFVAEGIGDGCVQLGNAPGGTDVAVAEAGIAEVVAGLRLDS